MPSSLIRRKRQRSIRVLLAAIFIVPLASLIGLWAFAASVTVTSAIREHNFKTENTLYGGSAQGLGTQLGQERLLSYEYLSSGRRMPEQPSASAVQARTSGARDRAHERRAGRSRLVPGELLAGADHLGDIS